MSNLVGPKQGELTVSTSTETSAANTLLETETKPFYFS